MKGRGGKGREGEGKGKEGKPTSLISLLYNFSFCNFLDWVVRV